MSNNLIKKANAESEYTPEMIQELIKCMKDPVYFINNYIYLQHPVKGRVPMILYDFQVELIRACQEHKRVVGLLSRQMGKSILHNTLICTVTKPSRIKLWILYFLDKNVYREIKQVFKI